jgi:crotonobetainyl-CoA:carnitine CoA-transferase CaiB-like acyl-CoA transferase
VRPALELAREADVVVENFRAGGAQRLGVSYEDVAAVNPDVVYCSITAFGSAPSSPLTGPATT